MKPTLLIIAILLLIPVASLRAQDELTEVQKFANSFIEAVAEHDYKKVWKHLDKTYRKQQSKFLAGNKKRMMDELFSGEDGKKWVTIDIEEVTKIEIAEVEENEDGTFYYVFRVRTTKYDVYSGLILKTIPKLGFEGASG